MMQVDFLVAELLAILQASRLNVNKGMITGHGH